VEGNVESIAEIEVLKMKAARICELCNGRRRRMSEEQEVGIYWP